jgi:hypothetical protein
LSPWTASPGRLVSMGLNAAINFPSFHAAQAQSANAPYKHRHARDMLTNRNAWPAIILVSIQREGRGRKCALPRYCTWADPGNLQAVCAPYQKEQKMANGVELITGSTCTPYYYGDGERRGDTGLVLVETPLGETGLEATLHDARIVTKSKEMRQRRPSARCSQQRCWSWVFSSSWQMVLRLDQYLA